MPGWRYSFKLLALLDMTSYLSLSDGETSLLSSGNDHCLFFYSLLFNFYSSNVVPGAAKVMYEHVVYNKGSIIYPKGHQ